MSQGPAGGEKGGLCLTLNGSHQLLALFSGVSFFSLPLPSVPLLSTVTVPECTNLLP
jgi:hypothetical protein